MKEVWKGNGLNGRKWESGAVRFRRTLPHFQPGQELEKLLTSFGMFAGIFQAKAVRLGRQCG